MVAGQSPFPAQDLLDHLSDGLRRLFTADGFQVAEVEALQKLPVDTALGLGHERELRALGISRLGALHNGSVSAGFVVPGFHQFVSLADLEPRKGLSRLFTMPSRRSTSYSGPAMSAPSRMIWRLKRDFPVSTTGSPRLML